MPSNSIKLHIYLTSHRVIYSKTTNIVKLKAQMDKNIR